MALKLSLAARTYIPEWHGNRDLPPGQQVRVVYKPLSLEDLFLMQRDLQTNLLSGVQVDPQDVEALDKQYKLIKHVLCAYVLAWEGVEVDGQPVDSERLLAALPPGELGLVAEVFSAILNSSVIDSEQAGNLSAPSAPANEGSAFLAANAGESSASGSATAATPT